jgi:hypothetical protein
MGHAGARGDDRAQRRLAGLGRRAILKTPP